MIRVGKTNIEERDLIDRVMRNLEYLFMHKACYRHKAVMDTFKVSEEVARGMCHEFSVNPDELINPEQWSAE